MQNSNNKFIERCKKILGLANIKTTEDDGWDCIEKFAVDWRKKYIGKPLAVCLPSSLAEVQKIVKLTKESNFTIVPQGGNTGLAGGATPDLSKKQIILSLRNLKKIRQIDFDNKTITLEAGCTLEFLQKKANELGLFFPLDFASRKEATVGGFLSTNAGGLSVLKYGNARSMCLGIEVVTPNGEVWTRLQGLRKDNSGYDLKDLFIGSEGTLGIITAATLSLTIKPNRKICALLVAENLAKTINFFSDIQKKFNDQLSAFEFMTQDSINLLKRYFPDALPRELEKYNRDIFILVEISKFHTTNNIESFCDAMDFHDYVQTSINNNLLLDGVVSGSDNRTKQIWSVRSLIPYASAEDGPQVKNDISLPISSIPKFLNNVSKKLEIFHGIRIINFGHLGDGNLHFNIACPLEEHISSDSGNSEQSAKEFMLKNEEKIRKIVHDEVIFFKGSIAAEHGVGQLRKSELERIKPKVEIELMRKIKKSLDPDNLMNPGKVI